MVNFIKFGEAFSMVIPSQAFLDFVGIGRCRDLMVNTVVFDLVGTGEEKVQTIKSVTIR